MNHIYRLVWSKCRHMLVAVAETAGSCRKGGTPRRRSPRFKLTPIAGALAVLGLMPGVGFALPTGGQVVSGQASISQTAETLTINQSSQKAIVNWQGFSIGASETVNFVQPSASSVALNRVLGSNASEIYGHLNANGQVFLVNPNGVYFAPGAQVNVGGIVASTLGISDSDFLNGNYHFGGDSTASVQNAGNINTTQGGYVAFISNRVSNNGTITSPGGTTALGAGSSVDLTLAGNTLLSFRVSGAALNALAANGGLIQADGGTVILSAQAKDALLQTVVNNSGVIQAQTVAGHNGTIELLGGDSGTTQVAGTLDASAPNGGDGGFIETSGAHLNVADGSVITTKAASGSDGQWLIDPYDFTIAASGGDITGSALNTALGSGNVTIQTTSTNATCTGATCGSGTSTGNGDIFVNDTVSWSANTLTLNAYRDITINSTLNGSGTAGLALKYGQGSTNGVIGGVTAGYTINAPVNLASTGSFSTQLGSSGAVTNYTIITSLGTAGSTSGSDLQGINGGLAGHYVLGADIDASATSTWNSGAGFVPVGNSTTNFTGTFDGLGHTISGLTINRPTTAYVGLFGYSTGTLRDVGLLNSSVSGQVVTGALAGRSNGVIEYAYADGGSVTTEQNIVGGLVGQTSGSVSYSYASVAVTGKNNGVTSTGVGGLIGITLAGSTISNTYATGKVSGGSDVGGLVGQAQAGATISNSYSTGVVSGSTYVGGLAGSNGSGATAATFSNSFWDTTTSAQGSSYGGTGMSNANMQTQTNFTSATAANGNVNPNWDFSNSWVMYDGHTYPLLRSFMTPLTVTSNNQSQTYTGSTFTLSSPAYSVAGADTSGHLFGLGNPYNSAVNVGTYNPVLWSDQRGYIISNSGGTLTITAKVLTATITGNPTKTYDGTTAATLTAANFQLSGFVGTEGATVTQTSGTYASAYPGAQNVSATLAGSDFSANSGTLLSNYVLPAQVQGAGSITALDGFADAGDTAGRFEQIGYRVPVNGHLYLLDPMQLQYQVAGPYKPSLVQVSVRSGGVNAPQASCSGGASVDPFGAATASVCSGL